MQFCIGQEDIETMGLFGTTVGKKVSEYIEKGTYIHVRTYMCVCACVYVRRFVCTCM